MISKKNLLVSLLALGSVFSALSIGCVAPVQQSMQLEADLYDASGNPMSTYFDYYLNISTTDGTNLTYVNSASVQGGSGPESDLNGVWTYSEGNLMFYTNPSGQTCADTCVTSDAYGCTEYATDCYDSSDVYQLDTTTIAASSAQIGIDTSNGYLIYNSSIQLAAFTPDAATFVEHDEFDTDIVVDSSSGGSSGGSTGVVVVASDQVKTHAGHPLAKSVSHVKPVKLASVPAEKMSLILKSRAAIESMKKAMAAKSPNATAAK